jgi:hypothetical protein
MEPAEQVEEVKKPTWGFWATVGFGFVIGIAATIVQTIIILAFIAAKLVGQPELFSFESIRKIAMVHIFQFTSG